MAAGGVKDGIPDEKPATGDSGGATDLNIVLLKVRQRAAANELVQDVT